MLSTLTRGYHKFLKTYFFLCSILPSLAYSPGLTILKRYQGDCYLNWCRIGNVHCTVTTENGKVDPLPKTSIGPRTKFVSSFQKKSIIIKKIGFFLLIWLKGCILMSEKSSHLYSLVPIFYSIFVWALKPYVNCIRGTTWTILIHLKLTITIVN